MAACVTWSKFIFKSNKILLERCRSNLLKWQRGRPFNGRIHLRCFQSFFFTSGGVLKTLVMRFISYPSTRLAFQILSLPRQLTQVDFLSVTCVFMLAIRRVSLLVPNRATIGDLVRQNVQHIALRAIWEPVKEGSGDDKYGEVREGQAIFSPTKACSRPLRIGSLQDFLNDV